MKKKIFCLFILVTILFAGCSEKATETAEYAGDEFVGAGWGGQSYDAYEENSISARSETAAKSIPASETGSVERMIVRSAELSISVFDPTQAVLQINEIASSLGGYVVSSTSGQRSKTYGSDETVPYGEASIRVPAGRLEEALAAIEALTTDPEKYVRSKNISGNDITSDYVDSQSRLNSLETTRVKLYEIMEDAATAEETLNVYMQISDIESQIEVLKGQLVYMEQSAALSSIYVSIQQIPPEKAVEIRGWEPKAIVKDAVQALINTVQFIAEFLIYFVITLLPVLIIIGLPLFFIIRAIVRSGKAKNRTRQGENSEISDLGKSE